MYLNSKVGFPIYLPVNSLTLTIVVFKYKKIIDKYKNSTSLTLTIVVFK